MSPDLQENKNDKVSWRKSLTIVAVMFSTVTLLFPMIFGARDALENDRRAMFKAMREDHLRRVAADQERLAERRALQHLADPHTGREKNGMPSDPNSHNP